MKLEPKLSRPHRKAELVRRLSHLSLSIVRQCPNPDVANAKLIEFLKAECCLVGDNAPPTVYEQFFENDENFCLGCADSDGTHERPCVRLPTLHF